MLEETGSFSFILGVKKLRGGARERSLSFIYVLIFLNSLSPPLRSSTCTCIAMAEWYSYRSIIKLWPDCGAVVCSDRRRRRCRAS